MRKKFDLLITNGNLITRFAKKKDAAVGIQNGKIAFVGSKTDVEENDSLEVIDAYGAFISPGLIDSHTHGGFGFDFLTANEHEIDQMLLWYASNGVTSLLPTLSAGLKNDYLTACQTLTKVSERKSPGAKILGIYIEGPYINKEKKGAQPYDENDPLRVTDLDDYLHYFKDAVRVMTLAPEIEGGMDLIDALVKNNVICSVGHSNATYEHILEAVKHGLTRSTHTFNAMSQLEHHSPGVVGAVMVCDDIFAEVTLDGYHVHAGAVKAMLKAKGIEKVVLITDSIHATGLGDGEFIRPGGRHIFVKDNIARMKTGSLAGSVLTLNCAVANAVQMLEIPIEQAVTLASYNVAASLRINCIGEIKKGYAADIIIHDERMKIIHTIVDGSVVY